MTDLTPPLQGYPRADGRKGIRNVVVVAYLCLLYTSDAADE